MTAAQGRPGFAVWLTGLPASGKSSLAQEMQRLLAQRGVVALILDSDVLRGVLTPHPSYTESEREWFYGVIAFLAVWVTRGGVNVLIAATAHRRAYRDRTRAQIERFAEVYVCCPLDICQERDPKGIYTLARTGRAATVPGVGVAYERPLASEAVVDTGRLAPAEAAVSVLEQLHTLLQASKGDEYVVHQ
ncbi:MAG TPA: adenylyl-sulfate kinase [Chloroflexi bacterium]|nr:adenylyl-sulfate kinase [Chloroflexota bacterium]